MQSCDHSFKFLYMKDLTNTLIQVHKRKFKLILLPVPSQEYDELDLSSSKEAR